jgi:alanine racemase
VTAAGDGGPVRALARVNLAAIERNVARLRRELAPATGLCAVVKADGYGHGAAPAARAALAGGARCVAVAAAGEAAALRAAGIDAPILVMGALSPPELDVALGARADVVAWDEAFVRAVAARGGGGVHVKLDSGMGRLGERDPDALIALAGACVEDQRLDVGGVSSSPAR